MARYEWDDLPNPYSITQQRLMLEEIEEAALICSGKGDSKDAYHAECMRIVGVWSARAGRLFAYNIAVDLREEMSGHLKTLAEQIDKQRAELAELRRQVDMVSQ